jgi:hypothetical protein
VLARHASIFLSAGLALAACPGKGAERPRVPSAASSTVEVGRPGSTLRGVASDGATSFAAFAARGVTPASSDGTTTPPSSTIEARRGATVAWKAGSAGTAGVLAIAGPLLVAAVEGAGTLAVAGPTAAALELRGDPGAVIAAFDHATGAVRWRLPVDSTQWALVSSISPLGNDVLVAGSFGGTLRIGASVVSSAGGSDGYVARVTSAGKLAWLVRLGGAGADAVQGVAATDNRIAIAGTFSVGAELHGTTLPSIDEKIPFGDAFVAELDAAGARKWTATFGSRADDAVAGVAIDSSGRIAVAATVHDTVQVGSATLLAQGAGDGLVVWYGNGGELGATSVLGGSDFDGLRSIVAVGDRIVVGGFFSGAIDLGGHAMTAGGGDDAFLAALDASGTVVSAWHVGGPGREDISSMGSLPGGFIAGVVHTAAANVDTATLAAPADPASGAALAIRGL